MRVTSPKGTSHPPTTISPPSQQQQKLTPPSLSQTPQNRRRRKAIEVVLRLEEPKPGADNNGGRRLTVTTIGSRMSWNTARHSRHSRNSRTSNASMSVAGGEITNPPRVLLLQRLPSHAEAEHEGESKARPVSGLPGVDAEVNGVDYGAELAKTDTVDFADANVADVHGAELARTETHLAERVVQRIHDL